ncbi:hypothetical protein HMPREF0322_03949 [Desulfitobacterium hafniense DP7]|uniref:Uncharacterized protein n=1 Tax=Desulfitobacterium hafniense DP7 TaxID=537010 RepID=G9XSH7_DESHA|nr:hypothetical protein HMPREF0322_03949 [Desulfitobacterium hafniense DP7]
MNHHPSHPGDQQYSYQIYSLYGKKLLLLSEKILFFAYMLRSFLFRDFSER